MNDLRTAILLAGLTALFMTVGYLIGGGAGVVIAFVIAAGTNLFSYWNADRLVYRCTAHRKSTSAACRNWWQLYANWHSGPACRRRGSI